MDNQNIRIEYVYHSGFIVEIGKKCLVFDYFQGLVDLKDKDIYVFSSHAHSDHFNPLILDWQKERPDIQYILSSDIRSCISIAQARDNMTFISPYEEKQVAQINVKAYNSTDEGVSFLVQCDGVNLFHAGDLNWWYWWNDSKEEIEKAEKLFKEEVSNIKGEDIDIAFFPVDPRLEHNYSLGAEFFIQEVGPKVLIPMHFGVEVGEVKKFVNKMKSSSTKIIELTQRGQEVVL
jgi:L-ascorbate metabolism protein UlaG (beta-lactamase superfamily)